nr:fused MFS/spermidine synthase [Acidobacteriota bacterium]
LLALSATSPLLQAWISRAGFRAPYRLFAVSNFASLAALVAYPFVVEPNLDTPSQSVWWSILYILFVVLCTTITLWTGRATLALTPESQTADRVPKLRQVQWFALAACGSMLLLSITNHIDENVAAVPLMWVLPLAVYLMTFVLGFGSFNIYRRSLWMRLLAFALGILAYALYHINAVEAIQISLPIFLAGLFICCLFCHGELSRLRPATPQLTEFYVMIAAGGAAGAIFVGLIAPKIFSGIYELPLSLLFTASLALALTWNDGVWALRALWAGVAGCMLAVMIANIQAYRANSLSLRRSFYGSLRVVQTPHAGPDQERFLFHGTIEHGAEYLLPPRRFRPTTYYGPDSGIGILLRECFNKPKRVGVIGLGTGTLAAYGLPGDEFRFFEINPQIAEVAQSLFFYLRQTPARTRIIIGDGRLCLERDVSGPFDVLALDAFSGDAIPVHLLTREALTLYRRHLKTDGVIAFHISNVFLDLAPVVKLLAKDAGLQTVLVHNHRDDEESILPADWILATNNPEVLKNAAIQIHSQAIAAHLGLRIWTDNYNNLFQIFKQPELRR